MMLMVMRALSHKNDGECRLPPIESRRAGLRGGKLEEPLHYSPDENRPFNEQSGMPEPGLSRADSGHHAAFHELEDDSHQLSHSHEYADACGGNDSTAMETLDEVQDTAQDGHMQNGCHREWDQQGDPMYQRSFAVRMDPVRNAPHVDAGHQTFFT